MNNDFDKREKELNNSEKDDNRIIADMSHLETRGLFSQWFGILDPNVRAEHGQGKNRRPSQTPQSNTSRGYDNRNMAGDSAEWTKEDRRALILYTMKYALGIGFVFIAALGLVIFLMTKYWK